jgi:hypothetical protein
MYLKRVAIILSVLIFCSCKGIVNDSQDQLNNSEDQSDVDELVNDITKDNYSGRVAGLGTIYMDRLQAVGLNSGSSEHILDRVFEVWPTAFKERKSEETERLRRELKKYRTEAAQMKAKGKSTTALDVFMQSEKADTVFSKTEKQFLKDAQKVFEAGDKQGSYYRSKLENLKEEYLNSYDLTDKELATIAGISESVGTFIENLSKSKDQLVRLKKSTNVNQATVFKPAFLLQTEECGEAEAEDNYTAPDCSFTPNWEEVGGAATLGAAMGMLGTTSRLGYYAASGTVFGAGSAAAAAGDFAFSAVAGAGSGSVTRLLEQYNRHQEWIEEHTK